MILSIILGGEEKKWLKGSNEPAGSINQIQKNFKETNLKDQVELLEKTTTNVEEENGEFSVSCYEKQDSDVSRENKKVLSQNIMVIKN